MNVQDFDDEQLARFISIILTGEDTGNGIVFPMTGNYPLPENTDYCIGTKINTIQPVTTTANVYHDGMSAPEEMGVESGKNILVNLACQATVIGERSYQAMCAFLFLSQRTDVQNYLDEYGMKIMPGIIGAFKDVFTTSDGNAVSAWTVRFTLYGNLQQTNKVPRLEHGVIKGGYWVEGKKYDTEIEF